LKSLIIFGLIIKESDNEIRVEFKLKTVKGINKAFKKIIKYIWLKPLFKEFVYNDDILNLDFNSLSFENILRESLKTEDLVVSTSSFKSDNIK
jgi:hypothetical protein